MRKVFLAPVLAFGLLGAAASPAAADDSYRGYDRDYHHSDYHDRDYRHGDYHDRDRDRDYWRARWHRHHVRYCRGWGWHHHMRYCHGWGWHD